MRGLCEPKDLRIQKLAFRKTGGLTLCASVRLWKGLPDWDIWKCRWNQLVTSCCFSSFLSYICLFSLLLFLTLGYRCESLKTWQEDRPAYEPILSCISILVSYCFVWYCLYLFVICIYLFICFCSGNIFHWTILIWNILKLEWRWDITDSLLDVIHAVVLMVTSWLNCCTYNLNQMPLITCRLAWGMR